jgi:hypothetical protein
MKSVGPAIEIYASPRRDSWPRVEKAGISSRLQDPPRDGEAAGTFNARASPASDLSYSGTQPWGSPLATGIPAGFIAQVLGQTLSTSTSNAKARLRAYAEAVQDPTEMRLVRWL